MHLKIRCRFQIGKNVDSADGRTANRKQKGFQVPLSCNGGDQGTLVSRVVAGKNERVRLDVQSEGRTETDERNRVETAAHECGRFASLMAKPDRCAKSLPQSFSCFLFLQPKLRCLPGLPVKGLRDRVGRYDHQRSSAQPRDLRIERSPPIPGDGEEKL